MFCAESMARMVRISSLHPRSTLAMSTCSGQGKHTHTGQPPPLAGTGAARGCRAARAEFAVRVCCGRPRRLRGSAGRRRLSLQPVRPERGAERTRARIQTRGRVCEQSPSSVKSPRECGRSTHARKAAHLAHGRLERELCHLAPQLGQHALLVQRVEVVQVLQRRHLRRHDQTPKQHQITSAAR